MKYLLFLLFVCISMDSYSQVNSPDSVIVLSDDFQLIQLDEHTYIHKAFTNSKEYGRYSSNGIIFISEGEAIVADTPPDEQQSADLLGWLDEQGIAVKAIVVNHFHDDCLGGLNVFHDRDIPSYSYSETARLAASNGAAIPQHTFSDSLDIPVGNKKVTVYYFGKAHSRDNTVLWIPGNRTLFGGCMVKSLGAGKGNLADADVPAWPETVSKIRHYFDEIRVVIPGHGAYGNTDLLDFTIQLFRNN